ncbi:MAG: hypothetical protein NC337_08985 [Roseburia sp.]|nr:hypothetical protein [Roseburia sp.]
MDINLEKMLNALLKIDKRIYYAVFLGIALLPVIAGWLSGEIVFTGFGDFVEKMFSNPVQNCLGALIVCSVISHLSKFNTQETIYSVIQSKKEFFNVIVQFSLMGSLLNAINYEIGGDFSVADFFNRVHLFVIVFCGAIVFCIFALRLVSGPPFQYTAKQVYPSKMLLYACLFLISCGISPLIWGNAKHEVILLCFTTGAALFVVWFLFWIVKKKTVNNAGGYPYTAPGVFSAIVFVNFLFNLFLGESGTNKTMQVISGLAVLLFILVLIIFVHDKEEL